MSVIVKNMEMPKNCNECELCACYVREDGTEENYRCAATMYPIHNFDERHKHCPLIEIKPHGRLIDADAIEDYLPPPMCELDETYLRLLKNLCKLMPTIIEAEGE